MLLSAVHATEAMRQPLIKLSTTRSGAGLTGICILSQDGATPAVLASKAGHREIANLIAAGGSAAGRHALPTQAPARKHEDSTLYTYDQLRVGSPRRLMSPPLTACMWWVDVPAMHLV